MEFLKKEFLGNTALDYITTLIIIIGGIIAIFVIKTYIFKRIEKKAAKTKSKFDDLLISVINKTLIPAAYFGVIYLSLKHLSVEESIGSAVRIIGIVLVTYFGIRFFIATINYALFHYWFKKISSDEKIKNVKSIMPIIKILIYGLGIFFLLDNLGFKVSTLVAGLGIGGVAVALAGQAILGDLFSYFSILFDRPFELGDFVIVGDHLGTIEHIGIKTTRIRSLGGEQLVLSNSDLTSSRVKNYKRMEQRRVVFKIGVIYQTTAKELKEIPEIIKDIINKTPDTRFDRAHFSSYGDFSLNFEIVYYVFGADYNKYMDIQQSININIYEEFEKRNIVFAYPTRTIFIEKED